MKWKIEPLFPSPLYIGENLNITSDEMEYINLSKVIPLNDGNTLRTDNIHILTNLPNLKSQIETHLNKYLEVILCPEEPLEIILKESWLNKMNINAFRTPHIHTNSFLSGVVYISDFVTPITFHKIPQQLNWFDIEPSNYNEYNCSKVFQDTAKNMIIIFPSNMLHSVDVIEEKEERLSISFNTFIKGTIGVRGRMTRLELK